MSAGYFLRVLIALDQFANALAAGWPDETISARCWRLAPTSRFWSAARKVVDTFFYEGHCRDAFEEERQSLQLPPDER